MFYRPQLATASPRRLFSKNIPCQGSLLITPSTTHHPIARMGSSTRRATQGPLPNANLYCSQCDTQIGIFHNEWVRLTSSYVYAAHRGTHLATEIANKTQVVPEGVSQTAVEGCTMAEVFCKKCSAAVGQYCKAAPTTEQSRLV
jgi:hypothetical protein